jgi:phosphatidylglycerol:prolipoprotein diacylglycerol transferase
MIPYFSQPAVHLGPLTIHAFGALVAMAVLVGSAMAQRRGRQTGVSAGLIGDLLGWTLIGGFVVGHVLDQLLYFPQETLEDPVRLVRLWEGLSSFGGFVGGALGATAFLSRRRVAELRWKALDTIAYGFPFGWVFGRLGCFVAFDHPGVATHFALGERFVDGVVRHNLGLEEALCTIFVAALFYFLGSSSRPSGFFVGLLALVYGPMRFVLDTMRIDDARYGGLTPAQFGCVGLIVVGATILRRRPCARVGAVTEAVAPM